MAKSKAKAKSNSMSSKAKGKQEDKSGSKPSSQKSVHNVKEWLGMVLNPMEATVVKSPAGTSVLCSKTRIIVSRDIAYSDTTGPVDKGYFSVIARPSLVFPFMIATSPQRFPAVGNAEILGSSVTLNYGSNSDPGFPVAGQFMWKNGETSIVSNLQPMVDSALTSHNGFEVYMNTATNLTVTVANSGRDEHYVRLYTRTEAGTWGADAGSYLAPPGGSVTIRNADLSSNRTAFTVAIVTKAGVPSNPSIEYRGLSVSASFNGYIPVATSPGSVYSFVNPKIVDTAGVENCRVTAMSLLVSNMGSATHDGGELVIANTRQSTIYSASSTPVLMQVLKALPEGNRWHSGIMRGGGYTFYTPDDLDSYEPHQYNVINYEDNALVASGRLDEGGAVRVIATFIVEFYTKSQLFERSMGPTWTAEYKLAHQYLQRGRMASGNEDHESMTKRIANSLSRAWNWAWENKATIELGAELAMSLL